MAKTQPRSLANISLSVGVRSIVLMNRSISIVHNHSVHEGYNLVRPEFNLSFAHNHKNDGNISYYINLMLKLSSMHDIILLYSILDYNILIEI